MDLLRRNARDRAEVVPETGHPEQVETYRSGKEQILGFLVGQAMKATQGKGNPATITELLRRKLAG